MPTIFKQRLVPTTNYSERSGLVSNIYDLADVNGNLLQDVFGNPLQVYGSFYNKTTQFIDRVVPTTTYIQRTQP